MEMSGHGYDSRDRHTKTFRGRSLEELLPQIRAELGADAIVAPPPRGSRGRRRRLLPALLRRGRGARRRTHDEKPLEARNDRATAEGLVVAGHPGAGRPGRSVRRRARARAEPRRAIAPTRCSCRRPGRRRGGAAPTPASTARSRTAPRSRKLCRWLRAVSSPAEMIPPAVDDDAELIAASPAAPAPARASGAAAPATSPTRRAAPRGRRPERRRWPPTSSPRRSPTACRSRSRARSRS